MLAASERYERQYRPFCDLLVTNNDLKTAVDELVAFVQKVSQGAYFLKLSPTSQPP
jgi:hypothetical protein